MKTDIYPTNISTLRGKVVYFLLHYNLVYCVLAKVKHAMELQESCKTVVNYAEELEMSAICWYLVACILAADCKD